MLTPEEIPQAEMQKRYDDIAYIQRVRQDVPKDPRHAPFKLGLIVALIASIALIAAGAIEIIMTLPNMQIGGPFIGVAIAVTGVISLVMCIITLAKYRGRSYRRLQMLVSGTPEAIGPAETIVAKPNQKLVGDETATKIKKEQKIRVLNDDSAARGFKRDTRKAERIIAQGVSVESIRDGLRANIAAQGLSMLESDFARLYAHLAYSRFLILQDVRPEFREKLLRAIADTFQGIGTLDNPVGDFIDYQHLAPRNAETNRIMGFNFASEDDFAAYFVHSSAELADYGVDHAFRSKMVLGKNHVVVAFYDGSLANLPPELLLSASSLPLSIEAAEIPSDLLTASFQVTMDDFRYLVTKMKKQYFLSDAKLAGYDNFFASVARYGVTLYNDAENALERATVILLWMGVTEDVASGDLIGNMILPYAASVIEQTEEEGGLAEIAETCFQTEEEAIAIKKSLTRHVKSKPESKEIEPEVQEQQPTEEEPVKEEPREEPAEEPSEEEIPAEETPAEENEEPEAASEETAEDELPEQEEEPAAEEPSEEEPHDDNEEADA